MTDAVKPCPFCGGESATNTVRYSEAHVKEQGWKQYEFYGVNCIVCGADNRGLVGHSTPEKAIAAWNRRTPPAGWKPIESDTEKEAARYRYLRDHCSHSFGMYNGSEPSPAEHSISWGWQQSKPNNFPDIDTLIDQEIEYFASQEAAPENEP